MNTTKIRSCGNCEVLAINGVRTHEFGCPEAWRDSVRECRWCGNAFDPDHQRQDCCDNECQESYHS